MTTNYVQRVEEVDGAHHAFWTADDEGEVYLGHFASEKLARRALEDALESDQHRREVNAEAEAARIEALKAEGVDVGEIAPAVATKRGRKSE